MKYHVYEIEEQEGEELEDPFYDLRFGSREGKVYRRIITKAQLPKQECKATLEDKFQIQSSSEKTCYKFSLSNLKQEDERYLYEKINGSIFE